MNKLIPSKSDLIDKFCKEIEKNNNTYNICPTELADAPDECITKVISVIENYIITIGGSLKLEYEDTIWCCEININNVLLSEPQLGKEDISDTHIAYAMIKSYLVALEYLRSLRNITGMQSANSNNNMKH